MPGFDEWLTRLTEQFLERTHDDTPDDTDEPSDVIVNEDGSCEVECRVCGEWFDSPVPYDELMDYEFYNHCGKGPSCCP